MKISEANLLDLVARSTPGHWAVASDENKKFYLYQRESSPIRYVMKEVPEQVNNYDVRLMALAKELAEEVLFLRKKQRVIFDKI